MQETLAFRVSPEDTQSNSHQETVSRLNILLKNKLICSKCHVHCFREFSEILQISLNSGCHRQYPTTPQLMNIIERVRNKSIEKVPGPAGIQTQDLLNTSQTLLTLIEPLGPLGRGAEDKLHRHHCPEAGLSQISTDSHSLRAGLKCNDI